MASFAPLCALLFSLSGASPGCAPRGADTVSVLEEASPPGAPAPAAPAAPPGGDDMSVQTLPDEHASEDTPAAPNAAPEPVPGDPEPDLLVRGPEAPIPGTRPDAPEVRGSIDRDLVRRIVRSHAGDVKRCYDRGLARDPALAGRFVLDFVIDRRGKVPRAEVIDSTLPDPEVGACVARAALRWKFPTNPFGDVGIRYPFVLSPG